MRIIASLALCAAIAASGSNAAQARAPSFSCARAMAADERAICHSPALSAADARLAALYRDIQSCTMMGGRGNNIDDQRDWLARRARCGGNSSCLARHYRARIAEFAPLAAKARKLMRAEQCPGPLR